jgi:hypothetical protein
MTVLQVRYRASQHRLEPLVGGASKRYMALRRPNPKVGVWYHTKLSLGAGTMLRHHRVLVPAPEKRTSFKHEATNANHHNGNRPHFPPGILLAWLALSSRCSIGDATPYRLLVQIQRGGCVSGSGNQMGENETVWGAGGTLKRKAVGDRLTEDGKAKGNSCSS